MKTRAFVPSAICLLALTLAACGGPPAAATPGQAGPTPDEAASPSAAAAGDSAVDIFDFGYNPATVEVSAGTSVTWTNTGEAPHTVTFEDGADSGEIAAGETYQQAFAESGRFTYVCTFHPSMTGVVNVSP